MALRPIPFNPNNPIPNQPFNHPDTYYVETNYGIMPLGEGLYIDPYTGDFTTVEPTPPPNPNILPGSLFYFDAGNPECYPGSGETVFDLGDTGKNGTIFGPVTVSGQGGGSFEFSYEEDNGIYVPLDGLETATEFSYLAWVRPTDSTGNYRTIFDFGNDQHLLCTYGFEAGDNELIMYDPEYPSGVNLDPDQWYNVIFTFKYPGQAKIYINNQLVFTGEAEDSGFESDVYGVGAGFDPEVIPPESASEPWNGQIAIAAVYPRELTQTEVNSQYLSKIDRFS